MSGWSGGHAAAAEACVGDPTAALAGMPCLRRLVRHAAPRLLEATIVPLVLFYASLWLIGLGAALVAALAWCYGALAWRLLTGRRVTGVLVLGAAGLTVRTILAVASGSAFVYFLQP